MLLSNLSSNLKNLILWQQFNQENIDTNLLCLACALYLDCWFSSEDRGCDPGCCGLSLRRKPSWDSQAWMQWNGPVTSQQRSKRVKWHTVRGAFPDFCFYIQWLLLVDSTAKGKSPRTTTEGRKGGGSVTFWSLKIIMTGFRRDKYCHMLQVGTNQRDRFFHLCLFILEIKAVKRAELLHYKLPVLKATQQ